MALPKAELKWLKSKGSCDRGIELANKYNSLSAAYADIARRTKNNDCPYDDSSGLAWAYTAVTGKSASCPCYRCNPSHSNIKPNPFRLKSFKDEIAKIEAEMAKRAKARKAKKASAKKASAKKAPAAKKGARRK